MVDNFPLHLQVTSLQYFVFSPLTRSLYIRLTRCLGPLRIEEFDRLRFVFIRALFWDIEHFSRRLGDINMRDFLVKFGKYDGVIFISKEVSVTQLFTPPTPLSYQEGNFSHAKLITILDTSLFEQLILFCHFSSPR